MRDFYCTYEAEMTEAAVAGSLVDRRWRGEMDVRAADEAEARKQVEATLREAHPDDTLITCDCVAF
jgi:hypothetical protein